MLKTSKEANLGIDTTISAQITCLKPLPLFLIHINRSAIREGDAVGGIDTSTITDGETISFAHPVRYDMAGNRIIAKRITLNFHNKKSSSFTITRKKCLVFKKNHYPDFIIKTKKGKIILLETKGDHLDAGQKIRLGNLWANKAGNDYRYFLVYKERQVEGAYTKSAFLDIMKNL